MTPNNQAKQHPVRETQMMWHGRRPTKQQCLHPTVNMVDLRPLHQMRPVELEEIRAQITSIFGCGQPSKLKVLRERVRFAPYRVGVGMILMQAPVGRPDLVDKRPQRIHRSLLTNPVD